MVSHHTRSALHLGGAAASIIGASLGIEEVSSTTATLKTPEAAPLSERKCTCKGITPTPPPCYSCTFNLQHSPPPYRNKTRSKQMRTGSQTCSTDSSNWGSFELLEENSQCSACEEASSSSASDKMINLDALPDIQNHISLSVVTNEPDHSTESAAEGNINLTRNDPRTTDRRSAYYRAAVRPKLVLHQTRARTRTAGAPRCETIQEAESITTQENPFQSKNVYDSDPLFSLVRERLGSFSVFRDNSFDNLTSGNVKLVTSTNAFESLCDTNISLSVTPLSSSTERDIPVTISGSTSSTFGEYQVGDSLQHDSSDDNSHHPTQTASFCEGAAAISNSLYESLDEGIPNSTDDTPLPSQVVIPE